MLIFIFLIVAIASAFFCSNVAQAKGYSSSSWLVAGFFFGFLALIAVAGLPDKKLRKYLLQIGMKQEAIKRVNLDDEEEEDIEGTQRIRFLISKDAKEEEIYKKIQSKIEDKATKEEMIRRVETTEKDNRGFGSFEFRCKDKDGNYLLILEGKKVEDNQIEWTGNL